jgi:hypothetical protein
LTGVESVVVVVVVVVVGREEGVNELEQRLWRQKKLAHSLVLALAVQVRCRARGVAWMICFT